MLESNRSRESMSRRLLGQKGKHQALTTLMRTLKESIEQTLSDAANLDEKEDN